MRVVIIEDEVITANDLAMTLKSMDPGIEIVAQLKSVKESIAYFEAHKSDIDLIFSDIQLGDGLSFEIFKKINTASPIIFCTAYDEYALNAFNVNSIHYMLKPFDASTVGEALAKYKEIKGFFAHNSPHYEALIELLNRKKTPKSILVYIKDKIVPISLNSIALAYIENEITYIITLDKTRYTVNKSLEEVEQLADDNFYRANRQFLVNRAAIKDTSHYFARKLAINLTIPFEEKITVSKTKATDFLHWLSGE